MNSRTILSALLVVLIVASAGAYAATGFALNPTAEQYPTTYYQEDGLTIANHDMATMGTLDWENDNGDVVTLDAHLNATEAGNTVSYLPTQLEADQFGEYPRKADEAENNTASALDASEWSTGGANASKINVTDATGSTAPNVQAIQIATDGSMASGDVAYAAFANQSITTDPLKRQLQLIGNVNTLDSNAEIQVHDADGDYAVAELNSSRDATATDVVANATGVFIYQGQIGQLPLVQDGDGTLDGIDEIRVVANGSDVDMTLTAVNVEKKSQWSFGTHGYLDADGNTQMETVRQSHGGRVELTSLDTLGDWSAEAVVHDLRLIDVQYRMQDKPSAATVTFTDAKDYPGFDKMLAVTYTREIPTGYELSHGDIDLVTKQSFLGERYTRIRYAEAIGDQEPANISDSSWTDLSSSLGDRNITVTVDSTVQPGATNTVQFNVKLLSSQVDALKMATGGAGGFWGGSGGSGGNPLMNMWNWVAGGVVGLLSALGIKLRGIGS